MSRRPAEMESAQASRESLVGTKPERVRLYPERDLERNARNGSKPTRAGFHVIDEGYRLLSCADTEK